MTPPVEPLSEEELAHAMHPLRMLAQHGAASAPPLYQDQAQVIVTAYDALRSQVDTLTQQVDRLTLPPPRLLRPGGQAVSQPYELTDDEYGWADSPPPKETTVPAGAYSVFVERLVEKCNAAEAQVATLTTQLEVAREALTIIGRIHSNPSRVARDALVTLSSPKGGTEQ